jgi:CBS domain-containing protein
VGNYHLRARDIMHAEVATILDDATVQEAAAIMRMEGTRSLLVEPHNSEDSYGIISYADIVSKVLAEGLDPTKVLIDAVMTKPAITIAPAMEVKHIARLFRQTHIGHAPVVDGGKLLGVVSMTDLVTEVINEPA